MRKNVHAIGGAVLGAAMAPLALWLFSKLDEGGPGALVAVHGAFTMAAMCLFWSAVGAWLACRVYTHRNPTVESPAVIDSTTLRLELDTAPAVSEQLLRAHFGEPDPLRWVAHTMRRSRNVGRYSALASGETELELWREDSVLLGPAGPRFKGTLRGKAGAQGASVLEGRIRVPAHVPVLLFLLLSAVAALGYAFGRHGKVSVLGCLLEALLLSGTVGTAYVLVLKWAQKTLRHEIVRALPSTNPRSP